MNEQTAAAVAAIVALATVSDVSLISGGGAIKARFTATLPGIGKLYRCGYFVKSDGEAFVKMPSFGRPGKEGEETRYVNAGSFDEGLKSHLVAAVQAAIADAV